MRTQQSKLRTKLGLLFVSAFGIGAIASVAAPAHAGYWRVNGELCQLLGAGTNRTHHCMVPDSSLGQVSRWFSVFNIEIHDASSTVAPWARSCLAAWNAPWFSCSGPVTRPANQTGQITLSPPKSWWDGAVAHDWTSPHELDHYAYVQVYAPEASGIQLKGIYYQW